MKVDRSAHLLGCLGTGNHSWAATFQGGSMAKKAKGGKKKGGKKR